MDIYGIKDCANLTLFDKVKNNPFLYTDYANVSTNEWSAERVYANAKGTQSIAWDANKKSTLVVEMEVFDLQWIALTAGSEIKKGEANIAKREVVRVGEDKKATITGNPVEKSVAVVPVSANEVSHEDVALNVVEGAPASKGEVKVDGNEITFGSDVAVGTAFAVYFIEVQEARTIKISADKFPQAFRVVADCLIREKETGSDSFIQIEYPNARPQSNFTITMSATEPTKLSVTFDLFPNKDKDMATYSIIG